MSLRTHVQYPAASVNDAYACLLPLCGRLSIILVHYYVIIHYSAHFHDCRVPANSANSIGFFVMLSWILFKHCYTYYALNDRSRRFISIRRPRNIANLNIYDFVSVAFANKRLLFR